MTVPKSISNVAARCCVSASLAVTLAVGGCTSDTVETPVATKADQKQMLEKDVDQTARSKTTGKTLGRPINAKSIKSKVLGAAGG
jgi:hypothetical protein